MGRNVTKSGFFVRKRVKRHFISWLWGFLIRRAAIEQHPIIAWQPTLPCVCCGEQIEQSAHFCAYCGVSQIAEVAPQQETEAMWRLSLPKQTEELQTSTCKPETSEMRAIRLADEGEFLRRYLVEKRLYCWLYLQIEESLQYGHALIADSKKRGFQQYPWLLGQLKERGAIDLIAKFKWRCALADVVPFQATVTRELPKQEMRNGRAN